MTFQYYRFDSGAGSEIIKQEISKKKAAEKELNQRLDRDFTYHVTKPGQEERFKAINAAARHLAWAIGTYAPACKEKEEAWKFAQGARMWANAAIACEADQQPQQRQAPDYRVAINNLPGQTTYQRFPDFEISSGFPGTLDIDVRRRPAEGSVK